MKCCRNAFGADFSLLAAGVRACEIVGADEKKILKD